MNEAPGWYALPDNPNLEQYFNGSMWIGARRPRQEGTLDLPEGDAPVATGSTASADTMGGLGITGVLLYILAVLTAVGAIIACYQLVKHGVPTDCDEFGCAGTNHPYKAAGFGVLAGGLVQAVVTAVIAQLCIVVDKLRRTPS